MLQHCTGTATWLLSGTQLGTALPPSALHPKMDPGFLANFTARPEGLQSFLSAPGSAEYSGTSSYETEYIVLAASLPPVPQ